MAKKQQTGPPPAADLPPDKIRWALPRLQRRIQELEALKSTVSSHGDPAVGAALTKIEQTLSDIFGNNTAEFSRFRIWSLDKSYDEYYDHSSTYQAALGAGVDEAISTLTTCLELLEERLEEASPSPVGAVQAPATNRVFVVHGRDHHTRDELAQFLRVIGLQPVILGEEPAKGRTIIEKLEQEGAVGFAVILLTADDIGGPTASDLQPRARQNVILELGYFVGKLGRPRVTAIYQEGVEIPTDYHGVEYLPLSGDWKLRLAKELRVAGLPVDMNKAI
jgi:predicted nucleotide-binding protein